MNSILSKEKLTEILAIARSASIQCSICQDNVSNPVVLPCKHYFCAPCLKTYMGQAGKSQFKCPNCLITIKQRSYYECPELENPFNDLIDVIEKSIDRRLPDGVKMPLKFINYPKQRYKCEKKPKKIEKRKSVCKASTPKDLVTTEPTTSTDVSDTNGLPENIKENIPLNSNFQTPNKRNQRVTKAKTDISVKAKQKRGQSTNKKALGAKSEISKLEIEITHPNKVPFDCNTKEVSTKNKGRPPKLKPPVENSPKENINLISQNSLNDFEPLSVSMCGEMSSRKSLRSRKTIDYSKMARGIVNDHSEIEPQSNGKNDLFQDDSDRSNLSDIYSLASYRFPEPLNVKTYNANKLQKAPTLACLDIEEDAIKKVNEWMNRLDYDDKNNTSITISDGKGQVKRVKKSKSFHGPVKSKKRNRPSFSSRITRSGKRKRRSNSSDDSRLTKRSNLVQLDIRIQPNKRRRKTPKRDETKMIDVDITTKNNVVVSAKTDIDLKLFSSVPSVPLKRIDTVSYEAAKIQPQISHSCPNFSEQLANPSFNITDSIIPMLELMERAAESLSQPKRIKEKKELMKEMLEFSKQIRSKLDNNVSVQEHRIRSVKCPKCSNIFNIDSTVEASCSDMELENSLFHKDQEIYPNTPQTPKGTKKNQQRSPPLSPRPSSSKKICLANEITIISQEILNGENSDPKTPSRHSTASSDNLDVIESTPGERRKSLQHSFQTRKKSTELSINILNVTEIDPPASIIPGTENVDYVESRLVGVLAPPPEFGDPIFENATAEETSDLPDVTELKNCATLTPLVKIDQLKDASIIEKDVEKEDSEAFHSIIEATPITPKKAKNNDNSKSKVQSPKTNTPPKKSPSKTPTKSPVRTSPVKSPKTPKNIHLKLTPKPKPPAKITPLKLSPQAKSPIRKTSPKTQKNLLLKLTPKSKPSAKITPVKLLPQPKSPIRKTSPRLTLRSTSPTKNSFNSPILNTETENDMFKTCEEINDNGPLKIIKESTAETKKRQSSILNYSYSNTSNLTPFSQILSEKKETNQTLTVKNPSCSMSPSTLPNTQQFFNHPGVASTPKTRSQNKIQNKITFFVATSRLPEEDANKVQHFCKKFGMKYTSNCEEMTHLIAETNEDRAVLNHTLKYLYAVAHHLWVLNIDWVLDSLKHNEIMPEKNYETLDKSFLSGPHFSRTQGRSKPLFNNYGFFIAVLNDFMPSTKLAKILLSCGGQIFKTFEELTKQPKSMVKLVISETDVSGNYDESNYKEWYEKYNIITVDITWVCTAVGRYRLCSLVSYAGYPVNKDVGGYPPELLEEPESSTHSD